MKETAQEYTARMLSFSAGADPLTILSETPARLRALLHGKSQADLRWTPDPKRWSITQIVAHLADSELVLGYRTRMILASPGTDIQAFDQDEWSRTQRSESGDPQASLAVFSALRPSLLGLVRGLTPEELDRFGIHAERGKESIRHLVNMYAGHDRNHLAQIERLFEESSRRNSYTEQRS